MKSIVKLALLASVSGFALSNGPAMAASFVNGGFESGDFSGWTTGSGYRASVFNNTINPGMFVPGGSLYSPGLDHSQVISKGYTDTYLGSKLGSTVLTGQYSARIEDTSIGGYASTVQQEVQNYTDPNIYFAYKAVLNGAHGPLDAATMQVILTDVTDSNKIVYSALYNAASGGGGVVGGNFSYDVMSNTYYTPNWTTIQLKTPKLGDTYLLQVLAADCEQTGHFGYVYLDGFGASNPIGTVPLPGSLPMLALGLLGLGAVAGVKRSRKAAKAVA